MANRNARPIGLDISGGFSGRPAVLDGLPAVQRDAGQAQARDAAVFDGLSDQLSRLADRQAAVEGQQAGLVAGQDPAYRPAGSTTIRGLAYEQAATKTYVDTLQTKMRDQVWQTYQANADDPAALTAGLAKLREQFDAKDVFPEIRAQFAQDFQQISQPYLHQAFRDVQQKQIDQAGVALVGNLDSLDRNIERVAAMPAGPDRDAQLDALYGQRVGLTSRAADARLMTQTEAARQNLAARQTILQKRVANEIMRLPPEQRGEALKRVDDERQASKGPLGQLDDASFGKIRGVVTQATANEDAEINSAFNAWNRDASQAARRLEQNFPLTDMERAKLRLGAGLLKDPRADLVLENIDDLSGVQDTLRGKPLPQARRVVAEMQAKIAAQGASEQDKRRYKMAAGMVSEIEKGLATDLVGTAEMDGAIKPTPLDFSSGPALAASLGPRLDAARAAGQRYEVPWKAFRPDEIKGLKMAVAAGGDQALAVAEGIVKASPRDASRLLSEIGDNVPELAHLGALLATGYAGNREAARDAARALQLQREAGGSMPQMAGIDQEASKELGNAMIDSPQDQIRVRAAAKLIWQGRLAPGTDPKSKEAEALAREAYQAAVGRHTVGGVDYGGVSDYKPGWWSAYKVAVPANIRADRFRDVISAIDDGVLDGLPGGRPLDPQGKPYTVKDIRQATPVRVPGGYRLVVGDPAARPPTYIMGPGGRAFTLDLDALEPQLRQKVPGAYLRAAP